MASHLLQVLHDMSMINPDDIPTKPGLATEIFQVHFGKPDNFKIPFMRWARQIMINSNVPGAKLWKKRCIIVWLMLYVRLYALTINTEIDDDHM